MSEFGNYVQYNTEIVVKMVVEVNDEEIANGEVVLLPDANGFVNVDDAIEWLGKAERHYIPGDLQARYDEFMNDKYNDERNDHGRKQRSSDSEITA